LGNDYARILAIFKTLSYKTQVSFLADKFAQMYKTDLLDYLKNGKSNFLVQNALNDTQVQTIIDFVNKLK
jgi:S-adenosylmethionine:diacylglycerol 3-amino-3-carboxypropyl transferase